MAKQRGDKFRWWDELMQLICEGIPDIMVILLVFACVAGIYVLLVVGTACGIMESRTASEWIITALAGSTLVVLTVEPIVAFIRHRQSKKQR